MLKKLVKYGNSSALVLDKALLELLNINEGGVVKIKTDGVSLIITPQHAVAQENVSKTVTPQEALHEVTQQGLTQHYGSAENGRAYIDELRAIYARYTGALKKLEVPTFQKEIQEVEKRFNGNKLDSEYVKAIKTLRQQYAPELVHMDHEVQVISQKYIPAGYADQEGRSSLGGAILDFKKVHEKYKHVMHQVPQLDQNPDYVNEAVLLAEKYNATKNSPEYIKEHTELITKYIPEYRDYQNELKMVAESLQLGS